MSWKPLRMHKQNELFKQPHGVPMARVLKIL